ncbi:helix-turn-helix domain-containing protein [Burkholderia cepacia]|uniref:helix-turn-helix domain-containing protein n=1 Tax=Burkholderia cepacia TaxID=292 RepID=UPI0035BE7451
MRSHSREARDERRRQVINLRKRGWTYDEITEHTDLSRRRVFDICKQTPTRTKGHLKKAVISHSRRLQKSPQRVARYFMHKPIRYAA